MADEKYVNVRVRASDYLDLRKLSDAMPGGMSITKYIAVLVDGVKNGTAPANYIAPKIHRVIAGEEKPRMKNGKPVRTQYECDANHAYSLHLSGLDRDLGSGFGQTAYADLPGTQFCNKSGDEQFAISVPWYEANFEYGNELLNEESDIESRIAENLAATKAGIIK